MDLARLFERTATDPEPEFDRNDVLRLMRTPGVRDDVKASARLAGSLAGTATRRDVARARARIGGYGAPEPAPTVDPADPLGVGRLLPATGIRSHVISKPRPRLGRR